MKNISALENIHKYGLFGNHDSKDELINIREIKDVLIYQIVKYKKSSISIDKIKLDNLNSVSYTHLTLPTKRSV